MSFSLPRFLRHIRPSDLGDYFEQRDIQFPEHLDWSAVAAKLLPSLKAAIEALPDVQRERVLDDGAATKFRSALRRAAIQPISSCSKLTCGRYSGTLMAPGASSRSMRSSGERAESGAARERE
jgi:hypothetical protein